MNQVEFWELGDGRMGLRNPVLWLRNPVEFHRHLAGASVNLGGFQ